MSKQSMRIKVEDLPADDDGNPRKITKKNLEKLKKSISENSDFFESRPILVNRSQDGTLRIIGGHQRLRAARELGMTDVPVFVFDNLSEEKIRYYSILDNDNAGTWDFKLLADFGVNLDAFNVTLPESIDYEKITATDVLNGLIYKPSSEPAFVDEFFDDSEYNNVKNEIDKMNIPEELEDFVKIRLYFFKRFRFDKIADYYARATDETRQIFRQLALVFDISGTTFEKDVFDLYNVPLENPDFYDE